MLISQGDGNSYDGSGGHALGHLHHKSAVIADYRSWAGEDCSRRVLCVETRIKKTNRDRTSCLALRQRGKKEMFEAATQFWYEANYATTYRGDSTAK